MITPTLTSTMKTVPAAGLPMTADQFATLWLRLAIVVSCDRGDGMERRTLRNPREVFNAITESREWEFAPEWESLRTTEGLEQAISNAWEYSCRVRFIEAVGGDQGDGGYSPSSTETEARYLMVE